MNKKETIIRSNKIHVSTCMNIILHGQSTGETTMTNGGPKHQINASRVKT